MEPGVQMFLAFYYAIRGVFRGAMGAKPSPGQVKSIDFKGFSMGAEPPSPWKKKIQATPGQIPEFAPACNTI